jgi:hypothetical protein
MMSQLLTLSGPGPWRPICGSQLLQDDLTQPDWVTLAALRVLDDLPCNHLSERVSPPLQAQSSQDIFIRCRESLHSVRVERTRGEHAVKGHRATAEAFAVPTVPYLGNAMTTRNPPARNVAQRYPQRNVLPQNSAAPVEPAHLKPPALL